MSGASVVFLSLPGLREQDLDQMPKTSALFERGGRAALTPSFPCVTWPVQANMLTGKLPAEHGVIANGFYWRDKQEVEMWTAWNDKIEAPQIWDRLHERAPALSSAVWFPMLSKGCGADFICMPAPIHNPDGSESLWCYTKPTELYGKLRDEFGHFPLQHFWGPLAGIQSSAWIADSAAWAAAQFQPRFFFIYLPHLDYAAQKHGPDGNQAARAVTELDDVIGRMAEQFETAYDQTGGGSLIWMAASEYVITAVDHVTYPNRILREAGLLSVKESDGGELIDLQATPAWALCDHQFSHVFVRDADRAVIDRVVDLFRGAEGIAQVLAGADRDRYAMGHERSGEVILISEPTSWQAYYWWLEDERAPRFARSVDIHRKPGYDPVELHFDPATKSIPLDATLIGGSHGAPAESDAQRGVLLSSQADRLSSEQVRDIDVSELVLTTIR